MIWQFRHNLLHFGSFSSSFSCRCLGGLFSRFLSSGSFFGGLLDGSFFSSFFSNFSSRLFLSWLLNSCLCRLLAHLLVRLSGCSSWLFEASHRLGLGLSGGGWLTWCTSLSTRGLVLVLELRAVHFGAVLDEFIDAGSERRGVRPHRWHHFWVQQDVDVVVHNWHLKSANSRDNVVVWVLVIFVRDKLAVDFLFVPRLGNSVHDAVGAGCKTFDRAGNVCEELGVLGLVVARVPLVRRAVAADFKHEGLLVLICHSL